MIILLMKQIKMAKKYQLVDCHPHAKKFLCFCQLQTSDQEREEKREEGGRRGSCINAVFNPC